MTNSADLIPTIEAELRSIGLMVEDVQTDAGFHRCGTEGKEHGKDGSYIVYMDEPVSLWCKNWRTGKEKKWTEKDPSSFSSAEREKHKERAAQAHALRERHYKAAAKLARAVWNNARPVESFPYLERKKVPSLGFRTDGKVLLIPMYGDDGNIKSLQKILPHKPEGGTDKYNFTGGETKGGYFPIKAQAGKEEQPVIIGEGFATTMSAHLATGYPAYVSFSAGNLENVGRMARAKYPDRKLVFLMDDDCIGHDGNPRSLEDNTGYQASHKAARACGGVVAVPVRLKDESGKDKATDFNDVHLALGLDAVRTCVLKAIKADNPIRPPFYVVPKGEKAGLYKSEKKGEDMVEYRLAPPLRVLGRTRDEHSNNWGTFLEWHDPAGVLHRRALPDELTQRQGRDWAALLASEGYSIEPNMHSRFLGFLSSLKTSRFITNTSRVGWYEHCFVLPDVSIGEDDGLVVLQSLDCMADLYQCAGTLKDWQDMAALCAGNPKFTFALCASFAGPLLRPAAMEGGGFSFEGASSCGKTTCLQLAASVWGSEAHVRTWRTTSNGLESVASLHNDGLLVLDEIGQATGRDLAEVSYMLANGSGKTRAGKAGGARQRASWRLLFLSSGEVGLADKLAEDGMKSRAGQEVRFAGIPVDKADVKELHGLPHAGALINAMKEGCSRCYGRASRAFLVWLVKHYDEVQNTLSEALAEVVDALCPEDAGEQVRRVARRFAIVHVAGRMAQAAGVLPSSLAVGEAVRCCFDAWLSNRGTLGASEDEAILAQVRHFIEQNGNSRFQDMSQPDALCVNRVGFRKSEGDSTEYYILPESFKKEVVRGFSPSRAARVLADAGWLKLEKINRLTSRITIPHMGRIYCYQLKLVEKD